MEEEPFCAGSLLFVEKCWAGVSLSSRLFIQEQVNIQHSKHNATSTSLCFAPDISHGFEYIHDAAPSAVKLAREY